MSEFVKIKTRAESLTEQYKNDPEGTVIFALLAQFGSMSGYSNLPEYDDQNDVERRATQDFRRSDYSEAGSYIDSLVKIADFWQQLASDYRAELISHGAVPRYENELELRPVALTRGGVWFGGTAEVFDVEEEDQVEDALEFLRDFLPTISEKNEARRVMYAALIAELEEKVGGQ